MTITWNTGTPASAGMDATKLQLAVDYAETVNGLTSVLVIKDGIEVHKSYYQSLTDTTKFQVNSIGKSLTSMCIGAALEEGLIGCVADKVDGYISSYTSDITLRDLLEMKSGVPVDYSAMTASPDWSAYVKAQTPSYSPGEYWLYSGAAMLLSEVIQTATGKRIDAYFRAKIGNVIGASIAHWEQDPAGRANANGVLRMNTPDMARIGLFMLADGVHQGVRILSPEYARSATLRTRKGMDETDAWDTIGFSVDPDNTTDYGHLWFSRNMVGVPNDCYFAFGGGGGQFIICIPSLDIVVVRTGNQGTDLDNTFLPEFMKKIVESVL